MARKEFLFAQKFEQYPQHFVKALDFSISLQTMKCYLTMEYGGRELFDVLFMLHKDANIEDDIFMQISQAVHHLHAHDVAHRDLKPENCVIDEYGVVRLIDFGLAKEVSPSEAVSFGNTERLGSPNYAAPEVFTRGGANDFGLDVWALGVMAFAIFFKAAPWETARLSDNHFSGFVKMNEWEDGRTPSDMLIAMHGFNMPPWLRAVVDRTLLLQAPQRARKWVHCDFGNLHR